LIERRYSVSPIDEEQDEVGPSHRGRDLLLYARPQVVTVNDPDAPGVYDFNPALVSTREEPRLDRDSISRHPSGRLDDRHTAPTHAVEQCRFPDIWAADEADAREAFIGFIHDQGRRVL
jgi:hypothetical protein